MPADNARSGRSGNDTQSKRRAQGDHGPKDIGGLADDLADTVGELLHRRRTRDGWGRFLLLLVLVAGPLTEQVERRTKLRADLDHVLFEAPPLRGGRAGARGGATAACAPPTGIVAYALPAGLR